MVLESGGCFVMGRKDAVTVECGIVDRFANYVNLAMSFGSVRCLEFGGLPIESS